MRIKKLTPMGALIRLITMHTHILCDKGQAREVVVQLVDQYRVALVDQYPHLQHHPHSQYLLVCYHQ